MSDTDAPEGIRLLDFSVLHPIRDFVIEHGVEEIPGHPLRYMRMKLDDDEDELVICVHAIKTHTRMRISYGDAVPRERFMVVVFEDEPESWRILDSAVDPQDLITLSMAIRAGRDIVGFSGSSDKN